MESEKTIHDVIKERMKLPEEVKGFIKINILLNILMAIVMLVATLIINITYSKVTTSAFEEYIKIFQIVFALVTIVFFETSYKKDSFLISFYGIEMFLFSIAIMFVPYFYIFKNQLNVLVILSVVFAIYYIFKSIFTGIYIRNDYLKNNISDVKEIVKDNKKGYIDEKSTKTLSENKKNAQKQEEQKKEEKELEKNKENKKTNQNKKDNNKKEIKKESTSNNSKIKKENNVPKEENTKKENKTVSKTKKKNEEDVKKEVKSKEVKEYTTEKLNENLNKLKKMKEKKENNK